MATPARVDRQDIASLFARQPHVQDTARRHLLGGAMRTLRAQIFRLPAPLAEAAVAPSPPKGATLVQLAAADPLMRADAYHDPGDIDRRGKGDRLVPSKVAPPAADPAHTGSIPRVPADAGAPIRPMPEPPARVPPGPGASRAPQAPPAATTTRVVAVPPAGLDASVPLGPHRPADLITRGAPGAPGTFPPLLRFDAVFFAADSRALPPLDFEHVASTTADPPAENAGLSVLDTFMSWIPGLKGKRESGVRVASLAPAPVPVSGALPAGATPAERLALSDIRLASAQKCLAEAVYFEAEGEPLRAQIAVALVVVNRAVSGRYPADICGVVYQKADRDFGCQFAFACDNIPDRIADLPRWHQAEQVATDVLAGKATLAEIGEATHFHGPTQQPAWLREMRRIERFGGHTFYRPKAWEG